MMQERRWNWGFIGPLIGRNLAATALVGLIYPPVAEIILTILYAMQRAGQSQQGGMDYGALFGILFLAVFIGAISGLVIGLVSGVLAAIAQLLIGNTGRSFVAASVFIGGLVGFIYTSLINLPASLAYMNWVQIGWIFWVAIPTLLAAGAAWWASTSAWHEEQKSQPGVVAMVK